MLKNLKKFTTVVADSSDFESIERFKPEDATTNPSLILKASKKEIYRPLIKEVLSFKDDIETTLERLFVRFGLEILKKIPGRVSIEIDARASFDREKSIKKAKKIISLFEKEGIDRGRILIKLAATWEGIEAARQLEAEEINCNMTLLFSITQAIACADAAVTLISPFVGRILDWHIKNGDKKSFSPSEDPGVISVKKIYNYYKKFGYKTEIMGASFRNIYQIAELAGCDLLTISPSLLEEMERSDGKIERKLSQKNAEKADIKREKIDEKSFRYLLNDDPMASDKLSEGIRKFSYDMIALEKLAGSFK